MEKVILKRLINQIDHNEVVAILKDLISVPGHVLYPGREEDISRHVRKIFEQEGIEVYSQEVEPKRENIIATVRGRGKGRSLALNGHIDTVPPSDKMDGFNPFLKDGKIYGLGAADMKGGVAAMIYCLKLIKKLEIELDGDLHFTGVIGEETGGVGTDHLINKSSFSADYFVVGEPTGLRIVNSHKGVSNMEIIIEGKSAHASMPDKGINAIDAMAKFICLLNEEYAPLLNKKQQEKVGNPTFNCGIIQGGQKINVVADRCLVNLDRRWIKSEKDTDLIKEIKYYLARACSNRNYRYSIRSTLPQGRYFGPFFLPGDHDFITICKNAYKKVGLETEVSGMQGWTDGATILNKGYPALIIGPGDMDNAHTEGEHIKVNELIDAVKFYIGLALEICVNRS